MKNLFFTLFSLVILTTSVSAAKLPSKAIGKYKGEKPAYTAVKNEVEISIAEQHVFVGISESLLVFKIGKLTLSGAYSVIKIDGGNYSIKANLTNEKSIDFNLEFLWNKKTIILTLVGTNGEPDTRLVMINQKK